MRDRVADVLAQRATLDRGATAAVVASVALHGGLAALAVYGALHASPPQRASMVNIQFAPMKAPAPVEKPSRKATKPRIEEPKPRIEEPKPVVEKTPPKPPEKNTVPLSSFGQSTKKGSENPAAKAPAPTPAPAPATDTTATVPVGGSGVTGIEGGDFPHTLYIQAMQRRIGNNWFRPQAPPGSATVVYFRVQRDGTITDAKVSTPSGSSVFDRASLSAVRSASPLNPLPYQYQGLYIGIYLTFR
jgi:TonB family protein